MTDRTVATVRVISQKDITFLDIAVVAFDEPGKERTELSDNHFSVGVGNHREGIVLLSNAVCPSDPIQNLCLVSIDHTTNRCISVHSIGASILTNDSI